MCYTLTSSMTSDLPTGAIAETVYIHSKSIADITYVTGCVRVKVKAIGELTVTEAPPPPDKNPPAPTDAGQPMQQQVTTCNCSVACLECTWEGRKKGRERLHYDIWLLG